MDERETQTHGGVLVRVLLLYGLNAFVSDASFLIGYYLLPEGFLRGSPQMVTGEISARPETFWPEFALTLLFNSLVVAVVLNLNRVRGFPMRYLIPISLGVTGGLVLGTNSFVASDLSDYDAREGLALGLTIGGLETLGFVPIVASTVAFGVYQYRSWWRGSCKFRPTKTMRLRRVRLSKAEALCLALGVLLWILAAYRETAMATGLLG
jgi:hypothetical protein